MSDATPRDDIAGLIERLLRGPASSRDVLAWHELTAEAATQLAALSARVKELEERVYSPDGRNWARRACDAEELLKDLCKRNHQVTSIAVVRLQRIADAEARATRLQQERDELEAQLPDGMKHCTITFHECEKGHGRLSATNWIDSGCPWCQRDEAYERAAKVCDDAANAWDHLTPAQRSTKLKHRTEGMAHGARCIVSAIRRLASGPEKEKKE